MVKRIYNKICTFTYFEEYVYFNGLVIKELNVKTGNCGHLLSD